MTDVPNQAKLGAPALAGGRSLSPALLHGQRICLALMVAMLLATVILTFLKGPSSVPLWFDLIMRGAALLLVACGYFVMERSSLLAREGVRLNGTIIEYREHDVNDFTYEYPVIRIEDAPRAGKEFESRTSSFPVAQYPVGSNHPVLAHPIREVFALDRPGRENLILGLFIAGGLVLFVLPEIALMLAP